MVLFQRDYANQVNMIMLIRRNLFRDLEQLNWLPESSSRFENERKVSRAGKETKEKGNVRGEEKDRGWKGEKKLSKRGLFNPYLLIFLFTQNATKQIPEKVK